MKALGQTPVCREELIKVVIAGSNSTIQVYSNRVGIGSEGHDLEATSQLFYVSYPMRLGQKLDP